MRKHSSDAGYDLVAVSKEVDELGCLVYGTGLAFEIPEGHVGLLFPRSSICEHGETLTNSVGVIDSNYRGEVKFKFRQYYDLNYVHSLKKEYQVGERVGQIIVLPYPEVEYELSETLSDSDRGEKGFGSTGK